MTRPEPILTALSPAPATVTVTQPFMPPLDEYLPYLEQIWRNRWLTNCGQFHQQLEAELAERLDVPFVSLTSNGTAALVIAMQALGIEGEVITTPFSFVATAHAIRLAGATPVFVDIDPATGNLDPRRVEAAITPRTRAILPVHCFGQPCDVDALAAIAAQHDLRLIYDAAHAFAVELNGRSVLRAGDMSTLSFHATKVFNTFEGGAIVSADAASKRLVDQLRNFAFDGDTTLPLAGTNGKMSEVQAAFGLLQLRYVDRVIARRGEIAASYREGLAGVAGIAPLALRPAWTPNHSYFPVLVGDAYPVDRDTLWRRLSEAGLLARRYFHPLICDLPGYADLARATPALPVARRFADQVLCLPLHTEVSPGDVARAVAIIAHG